VEVGLVLEEVEVSPFLVSYVVNGTVVAVALGARKASSALKAELNVQAMPLGVEGDIRYFPGRYQAERSLKKDAGRVFQGVSSCGDRDPGTIASTHSKQRGAKNALENHRARLHSFFPVVLTQLQKTDCGATSV